MYENITRERRKIIAINCMPPEITRQLKEEWDSRFTAESAILINASVEDKKEDIAQNIYEEIRNYWIGSAWGIECTLVLLFNFTSDVSSDLLKEISEIPPLLSLAAGISMNYEIQFGYVGEYLLSRNKSLIRESIKPVLLHNKDITSTIQRLFLVAKSPCSDDRPWEAPCTYLDIISRCENPNFSTQNDTVGFLKYRRFENEKIEKLNEIIRSIDSRINGGCKDSLKKFVDNNLYSLENQVRNKYTPDKDLLPTHYDMRAELYSKKDIKKIKKGNHDSYNRAFYKTKDAVLLTADLLRNNVISAYQKAAADLLPPDNPQCCLEKISLYIGLEFLKDKTVITNVLLRDKVFNDLGADIPFGFYENGINGHAKNLLDQILSSAISEGKNIFLESLLDTIMALSEKDFDSYRCALLQERNEIEGKRRDFISLEDLCNSFRGDGQRLVGQFAPLAGNGFTRRIMLLEASDTDEELDRMLEGADMDPPKNFYMNKERKSLMFIHEVSYLFEGSILEEIIPG